MVPGGRRAPRLAGTCWGALGGTARRLQLRTPVLEGFSGSPDQLMTLSAVLSVPTLAGLVRSTDRPSRLELASSLDVSCGEVGVISRELSVSAHVQAAEARGLFPGSNELDLVGLRSPVDPSAALGRWLHQGTLVAPADAPSGWSSKQIAACAEESEGSDAGVGRWIPRGICATFPLGRADAARSILEVKSVVAHSSLGKGLSCVLTTPIPGGPLDAMAWNTAEVGPDGLGDALGGWWPTRSATSPTTPFSPMRSITRVSCRGSCSRSSGARGNVSCVDSVRAISTRIHGVGPSGFRAQRAVALLIAHRSPPAALVETARRYGSATVAAHAAPGAMPNPEWRTGSHERMGALSTYS